MDINYSQIVWDTIQAAVTFVVTSAAFYALHKYFPNKEVPVLSAPLEVLKKKYRKWVFLLWGGFFAWWALFSCMGYHLMVKLVAWQFSKLPQDAINVLPDNLGFIMPVLFLALPVAVHVAKWIVKQAMGDNYDEFIAVGNYTDNVDSRAFAKLVMMVSLIMGVLTFEFIDDFHHSFGQQQIEYNPYWGFGTKVYRYSDVAKVMHVSKIKAPNGDVKASPHYYIQYNDGNYWSSDHNGFTNLGEHDTIVTKRIIDLVAQKAQLPLLEVEFEK